MSLFQDHFAIEKARYWGFPIVLGYDTIFLLPMNKRRARKKVGEDAAPAGLVRQPPFADVIARQDEPAGVQL